MQGGNEVRQFNNGQLIAAPRSLMSVRQRAKKSLKMHT
jgi:hypothetical protein